MKPLRYFEDRALDALNRYYHARRKSRQYNTERTNLAAKNWHAIALERLRALHEAEVYFGVRG